MTRNTIRNTRTKKVAPNTIAGRLSSGHGPLEVVTMQELAARLRPFVGTGQATASGSGTPQLPSRHGFGFFIGGVMKAGELIGGGNFPNDMTFTTGDDATSVTTAIPSASNADLLVKDTGGSTLATIHFPAGNTTATVTWSGSPYTLSRGTQIQLYAPATADAQLAFVSGTVNGKLGG